MLLPGNTLFLTPADGPWLRWVAPTVMRYITLALVLSAKTDVDAVFPTWCGSNNAWSNTRSRRMSLGVRCSTR
jgi:hypothetical protein